MKRLPFKIGPRGGITKITSIYFRKSNWTKDSAIDWLLKHNYKNPIYKKETLNNHVFKIANTSKDSRVTYRRKYLDQNKTISATLMILLNEMKKKSLYSKKKNLKSSKKKSSKKKSSKRKSYSNSKKKSNSFKNSKIIKQNSQYKQIRIY